MDHEHATIESFIRREKRERYKARLGSRKSRKKFMDTHFDHMRDLDERRASRIEPSDQTPERIYEILLARGAPDRCYVMSTNSDLDGQEADLRSVLPEIIGYESGTFVSCIPGKLAYFEGEEPGERYVLAR